MNRRTAAAAAAVLLTAGGCTSARSGGGTPATRTSAVPTATTSTPAPQVVRCPAATRSAAARAAGTTGGRARVSPDTALGLTTCTYRLSVASGRAACASASVRVDTGAQAYTDFNRWVDEQAQNASAGGPGSAPRQLSSSPEGRQVEWVPATQTLQVGVLGRWVTVAMRCGRDGEALRAARRLAGTVAH